MIKIPAWADGRTKMFAVIEIVDFTKKLQYYVKKECAFLLFTSV